MASKSNKGLRLLNNWLSGLVEYLVVFPILLLIGLQWLATPLLFMVSLPVLLLLGTIFRGVVGNRKKGVSIGFSLLVSLVYAFFLSPVLLLRIIVGVISFISVYRGVNFGDDTEDHEISRGLYWFIGFPIYFFASFFFTFVKAFHPYLVVMTLAGILMVIATLLIGNRQLLEDSTLSTQEQPSVPSSIKSKNGWILGVSLVIILFVSALSFIKHVVFHVFSGLFRGLGWLLALLAPHKTVQQPPQHAQTQPPPASLKAGEPSKIGVFLDKIAHGAFYIILILAGLWLVYFVSKNLLKWLRMGYRWLMRLLNERFGWNRMKKEGEFQYDDEKQSLFDFKKWRHSKRDQLRGAINQALRRQPKWEDLDDDERIRYTYRQVVQQHVQKGFTFHPSHTPVETLDEISKNSDLSEAELAQLSRDYDKVRYGKHGDGSYASLPSVPYDKKTRHPKG